MAARVSRRLVVDASVARSSGSEEAIYSTSKHCRDFLQAVRSICHQIVMTPDIISEWKMHQSNFARQWRVSMEARRKVYRAGFVADEELRDKIGRNASSEKTRVAMLKDCCLIEAAIATDHIIVSLDDNAWNLFSEAAIRVGELRNVIWVNPDKQEDQAIPWLESGARPEKKRRLRI